MTHRRIETVNSPRFVGSTPLNASTLDAELLTLSSSTVTHSCILYFLFYRSDIRSKISSSSAYLVASIRASGADLLYAGERTPYSSCLIYTSACFGSIVNVVLSTISPALDWAKSYQALVCPKTTRLPPVLVV
jgi:hypothetical protein